ncbi:Spy/CpxP family protein refolding chaperone [Pseudodesulfovibrio piezophilus]|uniref:Zinc resistance-associated protein n=1 Tax=Pseudodesulfovibrio piezophilus (strain DSM 21447 / JCM 15486 / C1TLV30) TaxID=1322246 RepID=M1WW16_PSEP2|nr:Spy/CpxP family protein refolding chaperone [Pseudodesulfovibrio piezophilus]CCH48863.1 Zinc resistance-associated protein [Pseudodesulfovibrio piezophilus C1TLV30]
MKKNITITALATVLVLGMAAMSIAGPGYGHGRRGACGGNGPNSAYSQLSPEKQAAADKIFQKYADQMSELRTAMWTKHSTLQAMINGGDANEKKIGKLTSEISELRDKMRDMRGQMGEELAQATGITFAGGFGGCPSYGEDGCPGFGGPMGPGFGRGHGAHNGMY